ncbi:MAG: hypothetical protein HYU30_08780 [Chloroflexi bacterium]|nr:hypothetical protein [Chloroflexota bacterium]
MNPAQTGAYGQLLVQIKLLRLGIDSARMTTDYGVDLVAFDPETKRRFTIQVKAGRHRGKVDKWVEWSTTKELVADYIALVDIQRDMAWLFSKDTFIRISTNIGNMGRRLWWYPLGHVPERTTLKRREEDFEKNTVENATAILRSGQTKE